MMLAVKKLCDIQKARNQAEGQGTLRRKLPGALELVAIEPPESGDCPSPHTPKMLTFQDSELSAELQTAMSNNNYGGCQDGLAMKSAAAMSVSQESIGTRSRGSGHSQEPPLASAAPHSRSQESLGSADSGGRPGGSPGKERNIPEGWDQRQPLPSKLGLLQQSPAGLTPPHTPSKTYPAVPAKPKANTSPVLPYHSTPQGSPAHKAFSYLHSHCGTTNPERSPLAKPLLPVHGLPINGETLRPKKRTQSLTRHALSDGEPDEDEAPTVPSCSLPSYATLTRRPGRSQLARMQTATERNVGRSQSFAVRARRKGPPPPPPKRLSSVSGSSGGAEPPEPGPAPGGGVELESPGSVRSIAAMLETSAPAKPAVPLGPQREPASPTPPPKPALPPQLRDPAAARRRTLSEPGSCLTDAAKGDGGAKSDTEEDGRGGPGLDGSSSPQNSSSECIPFAEEGNLTIKQRPKTGGPLKPPEAAPKAPELPEFNLKESDTVKRRHKPKESASPAEEGGAEVPTPPPGPPSQEGSARDLQSDEDVSLRIAEIERSLQCLEKGGSPAKPQKPPVCPKPASPQKPAAAAKPLPYPSAVPGTALRRCFNQSQQSLMLKIVFSL